MLRQQELAVLEEVDRQAALGCSLTTNAQETFTLHITKRTCKHNLLFSTSFGIQIQLASDSPSPPTWHPIQTYNSWTRMCLWLHPFWRSTQAAAASRWQQPANDVGVVPAGRTASRCGLGGAVLHGACRHCRRLCSKHYVAPRGVLRLLEGGSLRGEASFAARVRVFANGYARGLASRYNPGAGLY